MNWMSSLQALTISTLFMGTPLIFAAMGGFFSERAGVINIALEGLMLFGAFFAAVVTYWTHEPVYGLIAACVASGALALMYGWFVIQWRADQIVAGTAINFFAAGIVPFLCKVFFGVTGATPSLPIAERFQWAPVILVAGVVLFIHGWRKYSLPGLWHQFAGEHPAALDASGVSVVRVRWMGVFFSGIFCGMGGASLSIFLSSAFSNNMTAGRGFMALAALILGKWRPVPAALACILFAFTDAFQARLQGVTFGEEGWTLPVQFIQILPYVVTVLVLSGWVGRSRAPSALGNAFGR